jgi:hypothetical protein
MSTLTLTRSPRYIRTVTFASATYFKLELYIFTGLIAAKPATATYTINKDIINGEEKVTFEINQLIRDYYDIAIDNSGSDGQVLWVIADITPFSSSAVGSVASTTFLAFDGFNYFQEPVSSGGSINATYLLPILLTAEKVQVLNTDFAQIPVNAEIAESVDFKLNGAIVSTHLITDSGNTNQKIQYVVTTASSVDSVVVTYNSCASTETKTIELVDECKFAVSKIVFINKLGAEQNLYFFKKSVKSLDVKKESFNRNLLDETLPYFAGFNFTDHQNKEFNLTGNEALVLNSGYVNESMNETFKELLLSQYVWVIRSGDTLPVNVATSNITYKTALNDKLINYTINFKYAFDTINNVH